MHDPEPGPLWTWDVQQILFFYFVPAERQERYNKKQGNTMLKNAQVPRHLRATSALLRAKFSRAFSKDSQKNKKLAETARSGSPGKTEGLPLSWLVLNNFSGFPMESRLLTRGLLALLLQDEDPCGWPYHRVVQ